ncbi:MAG: phosphate butyryltransferase [Lachnospiraceae bacterium]
MGTKFENLLKEVAACEKKIIAVAAAQDSAVLEAVAGAKREGIADAVLFGDKKEIEEAAKSVDINLDEFRIIDIADKKEAALAAVKMVHDKKADMYMKGIIDTKTVLQCVLDKEIGLRTGKLLSHVGVFEVKGMERLLFITDAAFNIAPNLEEKRGILENAVTVARACGIEMPKVCPLAAVEVYNPKMQATVDGAELTRMNEEGIIKDCIVDGPLALDLAISREAAEHKGTTDRKIVGDADILLVPTIEVGNVLYKAFGHIAESESGALLVGTAAPVVLTSRSDSYQTKVHSIALAAIVAEKMK